MSETVFKAKGLTKQYGKNLALDNVNISLEQGRIYGLIGRNGAGKTTLLRLISGLSFPSAGHIELYGETSQRGLEKKRKRLGCLIERPAFYADMTASNNLELHRQIWGIPDKSVIFQSLETVGLLDNNRKKVKNFSTGMKQLLGMAMALLPEPEFLVLDEPTNGIDPLGVRMLRELLVGLNKEKGVTMLVSSHVLSELYQLATDFIIIHEGRIIEVLTHKQLEERCRRHILIRPDDVRKAAVVLEKDLQTVNFKVLPGGKICLYDYLEDMKPVARALAANDVLVTEFTYAGDNLEDYFVNAIGGGSGV